MDRIVVNTDAITAICLHGTWHPIETGTLTLGPFALSKEGQGPGFTAQRLGQRGHIAGRLTAIDAVSYTEPI